jgi:hypothetical protein
LDWLEWKHSHLPVASGTISVSSFHRQKEIQAASHPRRRHNAAHSRRRSKMLLHRMEILLLILSLLTSWVVGLNSITGDALGVSSSAVPQKNKKAKQQSSPLWSSSSLEEEEEEVLDDIEEEIIDDEWRLVDDSTYVDGGVVSTWKDSFPESLQRYPSRSFNRLLFQDNCGNQVEFYILGTCHGYNESVADVQTLLEETDPDLIMIENDPSRFKDLRTLQDLGKWKDQVKASKSKDEFLRGLAEKKSSLIMKWNLPSLNFTSDGETSSSADELCLDELKNQTLQYISTVLRPTEEQLAALGFVGRTFLEAFDKDRGRIQDEFNEIPGAEMLSAYQYYKRARKRAAKEVLKSDILSPPPTKRFLLGDRPIQITFARFFRKRELLKIPLAFIEANIRTVFSSKFTIANFVLLSAIAWIVGSCQKTILFIALIGCWIMKWEHDKYNDMSSQRDDAYSSLFDKEPPQEPIIEPFRRTFLHERDRYMACKLIESVEYLRSRSLPGSPWRIKVVAVVGRAHVPGIANNLAVLMTENAYSLGLVDLMLAELLHPYIQLEPGAI